ncbi:MAG: hypothetical protein ABIR24_07610 [Verrucomicrobiota bacterium]
MAFVQNAERIGKKLNAPLVTECRRTWIGTTSLFQTGSDKPKLAQGWVSRLGLMSKFGNRSRRRKEADYRASLAQGRPPPHVVGYDDLGRFKWHAFALGSLRQNPCNTSRNLRLEGVNS